METKNIEIVGSVFRKFKQISPRWAKMFLHELKANSQKLSDIGEREYDEINNLLGEINCSSGYIVDIAASDGVSQSCTLPFFKKERWSGLAIEMDPAKFTKLAYVYEKFINARLARVRVVPSNIRSILEGFEVPKDFSFLNIDIDSYDLEVINEILSSGFKPLLISMEINEKIPPSMFFTVKFNDKHYWQGDHFFGCSIGAAVEIIKPHGYKLSHITRSNAFFVCSNTFVDKEDLDASTAYDQGYRYIKNRELLYPYNKDVDCLLEMNDEESLAFINKYFAKYAGKYEARII
tara:strand:+ start:70 stop:945 length:876 start_codon:yes stop_codon:yes gene_type:complete